MSARVCFELEGKIEEGRTVISKNNDGKVIFIVRLERND